MRLRPHVRKLEQTFVSMRETPQGNWNLGLNLFACVHLGSFLFLERNFILFLRFIMNTDMKPSIGDPFSALLPSPVAATLAGNFLVGLVH